MTYNPDIHHRRSIRLQGYDYSRAGLYFITICCQDRICRFGEIVNDAMQLNEYGQIAYDEWIKLAERFPHFELDVFQIMPNHMHGIIMLNDTPVGAGFTPAQNNGQPHNNGQPFQTGQPRGIAPTTVGGIVGAYKSLVANGCLKMFKSKNETMGKLWQRNYYEHIIRNEPELNEIRTYIINNPLIWQSDENYSE